MYNHFGADGHLFLWGIYLEMNFPFSSLLTYAYILLNIGAVHIKIGREEKRQERGIRDQRSHENNITACQH